MASNGREITALLISPNRELADQFSQSVAKVRGFQVVSDLKHYPGTADAGYAFAPTPA